MRNPFSKDPIKREAVEDLRNVLTRYWEDTELVTKEGDNIIQIGNLRAILDTYLQKVKD